MTYADDVDVRARLDAFAQSFVADLRAEAERLDWRAEFLRRELRQVEEKAKQRREGADDVERILLSPSGSRIEDSKGALLDLVSSLRDRVEGLEIELHSLRSEVAAGKQITPRH